MNVSSRLYALMATARVANVPSLVSNLAVGVLLGAWVDGEGFRWPWLLLLAVVMFYVGGNFLNDWKDREWDSKNRAERALPSGLFSEGSYLVAAMVLFLGGLSLAAFYGLAVIVCAVVLVGLIVLYTVIHKLTAFSVIPMGLCRALLPVMGYVAVGGGFAGLDFYACVVLSGAVGLFLYVAGLSVTARFESRPDSSFWMMIAGKGLLIASALFPAAMVFGISPGFAWVGLVPFALWLGLALTRYRKPIPVLVSALLAGIPLVDWVILLPIVLIGLMAGGVGFSDRLFLCALLISPVCFVLGRILQRVAPAT